MKTTTVLALAASYVAGVSAVTGQLGDAVPVLDNPVGVSYQASFDKNGVKGSILASSDPAGVKFDVSFSGLPTEGGPFLYHLHVDPVPASGNCTLTLAHLDPYIRGEADPCDPSMPATCQVGDLSGKFGKINGTSLNQSYVDPYPSLKPGIGAFFGNRSIVLHFANKTRIACANFTMVGGSGYAGMGGNGTWNGTMMPSSSATASMTGGAAMTSSMAAASGSATATSAKPTAPMQTTNAGDKLSIMGATSGCAALALAMGWAML